MRPATGVSFAARPAFEDLWHSFGHDAETLRGVTLAAAPGEVLCLLGPSGSGKTTLLRIAAGIESQTRGRVLLNDREIAGPSVFLPPEKRSIGLVFQDCPISLLTGFERFICKLATFDFPLQLFIEAH